MADIDDLARRTGPLRFERIEISRVVVPMGEPFRISSGGVSRKEALLLRVQEGDAFGWGESSAMPGGFYSPETPDGCWTELVNGLLPGLAGRTFPHVAALDAFLTERTGNRFVRVAVETAAWELVARRQRVSLRTLFGLPHRPVPSGLAVGLYDTEDGLRDALRRYRPRDYARLKIKIRRGQDQALVHVVREGYPDVPLFVDANADYTRADVAAFEAMDAFRLLMFEQPFGKEDLGTAAELQRRVATPICLDESITSAAEARAALDRGACRIVNIKLQRVGGFLEAFRIIAVCAARGVPVWMGTMPELGVGSAQALVLASHPACRFPTDVEPSARWYVGDVLTPELTLHDGHLHLPDGPGLGSTVDPDALDRWTIARETLSGS